MLILPQNVLIKWNGKNRKHYELKGYIFTKAKQEFEVNVEDLPRYSFVKIHIKCDYCNKQFEVAWNNYNNQKEKCPINKDCCRDCAPLKLKEANLIYYGVENCNQREEVKQKTQETCLQKYGCKHVFQSDIIKEKIKKTNLEKYGYECNLNNPEIRKKAIIKTRSTMYKNGTVPCSQQQRHLHKILNGELNYPVGNCSLDIAFPDEMIYIEYDGGGHNWGIKKWKGEKEAQIYDMKRKNYLQSNGWKLIRIISPDDILLSDNIIIKLIKECKFYLKQKHSWIEINIGEHKIKCSQYEKILRKEDYK